MSGPSGVGKGAVIARLLALVPHARESISVTTRDPRADERDGVDYRFVDDDTFDELIARNQLLEWAPVHGWRYGTPRRWVEEQLEAGRLVVLEIDVQGATQVKKMLPDAKLVFLEPPSWEELERRLDQRGTEEPSERARRLATAREELEARSRFDHVIVNDDLETCVEQVRQLLGGTPEAAPG